MVFKNTLHSNIKKTKIAFVVRTVGLEYDDRIRKECLTLIEQNVELFIYVNFSDNRVEEGVTSYGVPYLSFKLVTRDKLPSGRFLFIKAAEFYLRVFRNLKNYDVTWAHEEYTFIFPLLAKKGKCVWDLHEIPFRFERKFMSRVFQYIESKSKKIIHANKNRVEYLKKNKIIRKPEKHVFINNFPDSNFRTSTKQDLGYEDFIKWLGNEKYVYLQGLSVPKRHPINTLESILNTSDLKAVVIGEFDANAYSHLLNKYGKELEKRIYFIGMVEQLAITNYLRNAQFSIILYDISTANNLYCEPNRLYQSIIMNVPVLVGCNPPMKGLVERYHFGVALESDGSNVVELISAVKTLSNNRNTYLESLEKFSNKVIWQHDCIDSSWYS